MIELLAVILAGFSFGIAVGIGVAVGLELVRRITDTYQPHKPPGDLE